jgi:hypothetical protein
MIGELQMRLGAADELIMLERHVPGRKSAEVFIGVPLMELLSIFGGFTQVSESELPHGLIPLDIREEGFQGTAPADRRQAACTVI